MNKDEFESMYGHLSQKTKVLMKCSCSRERTIYKEKAQENINTHDGEYVCRRCSMIKNHETNPRSDETKELQRKGRLGKKHSDESKRQMSEAAKAKWETDWGVEQKKKLSKLTASKHANTNMDKSKRKILYVSAKNNNEVRVCNSSGEFVLCEDFFEKDPAIIKYETQVPYEIGGRDHSLDFLLHYADGKKKAIEFKPKKRVNEDRNIIQIEDSAEHALNSGWDFELWTEDEAGIKSWKEATRRADEYRKTHYMIDYASYRRAKDNQKANRHYSNKIAKDKVIVYCDHCGTYHSRLRVVYDRNVKKNGRYICIVENGQTVGKMPKPHLWKENPYAEIGKKECNECHRVLPFECFGTDKTKKDGHATRCKECRATKNKAKYHEGK